MVRCDIIHGIVKIKTPSRQYMSMHIAFLLAINDNIVDLMPFMPLLIGIVEQLLIVTVNGMIQF